MAKKFKVEKTSLYQKVSALESDCMWPFQSVSPQDFIKSSAALLEMSHNLKSRKIENRKVSAEAYMDRTIETSFAMLKCIHKMELEASSMEMNSMVNLHRDGICDMSFLSAHEFVDYAINTMYEHNNTICDKLAKSLQKHGVEPRYLNVENERTYILEEECAFAKRATSNHYNAMELAYLKIENLIKYGLPADDFVGKVKDRIAGSASIKEDNQFVVDNLIHCEADLEVLVMYMIPEIELKIQEYEAKAIIEAETTKPAEQLNVGDLQQTDPYFFRHRHQEYLKARQTMEEVVLLMQQEEKKLESSYKISIKKDQKTATYVLVAQWSNKEKDFERKSQQTIGKTTQSSQVEKETDRKEKSVKIVVGQSSSSLYEITKREAACKFGYINRQETKGKDLSIANILSIQTMRHEAMVRRRTKVLGKDYQEYKASKSFDALKIEDQVVLTKRQDYWDDKQKTLIGASVNVGHASIEYEGHKVVPVIKGSASIASANIQALGMFKAGVSAGSIGYSSDVDLIGTAKGMIKEHLIEDEEFDAKMIAEETFGSVIDDLSTVSVNQPAAQVQILGQTVIGVKYEDGIKVSNNMQEIEDQALALHDGVVDKLSPIFENVPILQGPPDVAQEECLSMLDEIINISIQDMELGKYQVDQLDIMLGPPRESEIKDDHIDRVF